MEYDHRFGYITKLEKKKPLISSEFYASIHKNIDIDNSKGELAYCCMSSGKIFHTCAQKNPKTSHVLGFMFSNNCKFIMVFPKFVKKESIYIVFKIKHNKQAIIQHFPFD